MTSCSTSTVVVPPTASLATVTERPPGTDSRAPLSSGYGMQPQAVPAGTESPSATIDQFSAGPGEYLDASELDRSVAGWVAGLVAPGAWLLVQAATSNADAAAASRPALDSPARVTEAGCTRHRPTHIGAAL